MKVVRLYAATGDSIARLEEIGDAWTVELSLLGSGAQCLAVDPHDPETVYAGLREGGVRRTRDAGRNWVDCPLPEPAVFSLAVSAADGIVMPAPSRVALSECRRGETWRELDALLELRRDRRGAFPAAMDITRALDRAEPARRRPPAGRDRARRADALHDGGATWEDHVPAHNGTCIRWPGIPARPVGPTRPEAGRRVQRGRWRDLAARRRGPRPPLHVVGRRRPGRPRLLVRVGEYRSVRRTQPAAIRRRASTGDAAASLAAARRRPAGAARGDALRVTRD